MEQPRTLLHERDAQIVRGFKDGLVIVTAYRAGDIFHAASGGSVDVVDEWELFSGQHFSSKNP